MWLLLREVSWRHFKHAPLRSLLVVFGIALGVATWSAVLATNRSLDAAFQEMVQDVSGKADLTVAGGTSGIPGALVSEVAQQDGVEHAAATLEVITHVSGSDAGPILVLGVDFLGDAFFLPWSRDRTARVVDDPLAFVNDPSAVLLTTTLARAHGLQVGDAITLVASGSDKTFYVRGLIEPSGPAAVFAGQVVVMFLDAAQLSFGRGFAVDRIDVGVQAGRSVTQVEAALRARLSGRAEVERPAGRTERLAASLTAFRAGLNLSAVVALLVGMFLIYNAVSVSVTQRRHEVGVMRSLGVTKHQVVRLFCAEALMMATLGVGLGLALAVQLSRAALTNIESTISEIVIPIRPAAPVITAWIAAAGALAGVSSTLLAAYVPARRTNLIEPAEALRATRARALLSSPPVHKLAAVGVALGLGGLLLTLEGGATAGYAAITSLLVGVTLLVPGCIVWLKRLLVKLVERLLGVPGRLALDNVERALGRSALTVGALTLAVGMSLSIAAYAVAFEQSVLQWADDAFPADVTITKGSPLANRHALPFGESALDPIRALPGLASINPVRLSYHYVAGRRIQLAASDTRVDFEQARATGRMRHVTEGPRELATSALFDAPRALISQNMANLHGLAPGQTVRIATPLGEKTFEIYAVVIDYSCDQGWMLIDRRWYHAYWDDRLVDSANLRFERGADTVALLEQLRQRLGRSSSLFVTPHENLRRELGKVARNVFAVARAPELIALIVALMGVLGTMLSTVLDRVPEIGMLRATGATRAQVVMSIVTESGFLGLSAVVCGLVSGVGQGYILLQVISRHTNGWTLAYGFPAEAAARTAVFIVAAALCAGLLPGRRAARLDVKTALAYE